MTGLPIVEEAQWKCHMEILGISKSSCRRFNIMVTDMIIRGLNTIVPGRESMQPSRNVDNERIDHRVREAILYYLTTE